MGMSTKDFEAQKADTTRPFFIDRTDGSFPYRLIERSTGRVLGTDGGEPEDQLLVRDWQWVVIELNKLMTELSRLRPVVAKVKEIVKAWAISEEDDAGPDADMLVMETEDEFEVMISAALALYHAETNRPAASDWLDGQPPTGEFRKSAASTLHEIPLGCNYKSWISRVCSRGTGGCEQKHDEKSAASIVVHDCPDCGFSHPICGGHRQPAASDSSATSQDRPSEEDGQRPALPTALYHAETEI